MTSACERLAVSLEIEAVETKCHLPMLFYQLRRVNFQAPARRATRQSSGRSIRISAAG